MKIQIKSAIFLAFSFLYSVSTIAGPAWESQIKKWEFNRAKQSFCYMGDDGKVRGTNTKLSIKLASVSKLYTTYFALEKLGAEKEFETKVYVKGNLIHIEGDRDPVFGYRKLYYTLYKLNEAGFTSFDKLTFDSNLIVSPSIVGYNEIKKYPSKSRIKKDLKKYFNTVSWSKSDTTYYKTLTKRTLYPETQEFLPVDGLEMTATEVELSDEIPFEVDEETKVLTITSSPLHVYLKFFNVTSNNGIAQFVFDRSGGIGEFTKLFQDNFNYDPVKFKFRTGSGLPIYRNGKRLDNFSTCHQTMHVLDALDEIIHNNGLEISDVVAIPGVDRGTFKKRFRGPKLRRFMAAKSGTLNSASALAGYFSSEDGMMTFGLFERTWHIWKAKRLEDAMMLALQRSFGKGPLIEYTKRKEFFSIGKEATWE